MLEKVLKKIFGDKNIQDLKHYEPVVREINEIYSGLEQYEDEQLINRIQEIKQEIADKLNPLRNKLSDLEKEYRETREDNERNRLDNSIDTTKKELKLVTKNTVDDYLPEVFAIVKDTCRRMLGQKFEVRGHEVEWNMVPFDVQLIGAMALHLSLIHI